MKIHASITTDRLIAAAEESMFGMQSLGFCIACGEEHDGIEPDAERYKCHCCGQCKVYGAEQLVLRVVA